MTDDLEPDDVPWVDCTVCKGRGWVQLKGYPIGVGEQCAACDGTGNAKQQEATRDEERS